MSSGELDFQHLGRVIMSCWRFCTYLPCKNWYYTVKTEAWLNSSALLPSRLELSILDHTCKPAHNFVLLWEPHTRTSKRKQKKMRRKEWRKVRQTIFKSIAFKGSKLKGPEEEIKDNSPGISVFFPWPWTSLKKY